MPEISQDTEPHNAWRHLLSTKRNFLPGRPQLIESCTLQHLPVTYSDIQWLYRHVETCSDWSLQLVFVSYFNCGPSVGSCFMMSGESKMGWRYIHALDSAACCATSWHMLNFMVINMTHIWLIVMTENGTTSDTNYKWHISYGTITIHLTYTVYTVWQRANCDAMWRDVMTWYDSHDMTWWNDMVSKSIWSIHSRCSSIVPKLWMQVQTVCPITANHLSL